MCDMRYDETVDKIRIRDQGAIGDLHAADARYHKDCHDMFMYSKSSRNPSTQKTKIQDKGLQKVINIMTEDMTIMWNSVELYDFYKCHGGSIMSRRTLTKTLEETFGSEILVL